MIRNSVISTGNFVIRNFVPVATWRLCYKKIGGGGGVTGNSTCLLPELTVFMLLRRLD
jgi:hypothetical protein